MSLQVIMQFEVNQGSNKEITFKLTFLVHTNYSILIDLHRLEEVLIYCKILFKLTNIYTLSQIAHKSHSQHTIGTTAFRSVQSKNVLT